MLQLVCQSAAASSPGAVCLVCCRQNGHIPLRTPAAHQGTQGVRVRLDIHKVYSVACNMAAVEDSPLMISHWVTKVLCSVDHTA